GGTGDSVCMTKRDSAGYTRWAFAHGAEPVVAHVPQMYSLYELYFAAALARPAASTTPAADTVPLRQFYIDREFDRFPLGHATVRRLPGSKVEVWHDWLSGIGEATLDSSHRLLTYSGARTTYTVDDVGADHARRDRGTAGDVYAVDCSTHERWCGPDRQQAERSVGHRVRRRARPRHGAHADGDTERAGLALHDFHRWCR